MINVVVFYLSIINLLKIKTYNFLITLALILFFGCSDSNKKQSNSFNNQLSKKAISILQKVDSQYEEVRILDIVKLNIPKSLKLMSNQRKSEVYADNVRPAVVYSNEDISVSLTFSAVPQEINDGKLSDLLPVMAQQFRSVYPQIQWIEKGMKTINEKLFIEYEFLSPTAKKEVYSLVYITNISGELLISTFNCTVGQKDEWESIAKELIQSIKVIKN